MNIFLPYKSYLDDTVLLISTLSILIDLLFLRNAFLLTHCLSKIKVFCPIFVQCKEKSFLCWFFCSTITFLVFCHSLFIFFRQFLTSFSSMLSFLSFSLLDNYLYLVAPWCSGYHYCTTCGAVV